MVPEAVWGLWAFGSPRVSAGRLRGGWESAVAGADRQTVASSERTWSLVGWVERRPGRREFPGAKGLPRSDTRVCHGVQTCCLECGDGRIRSGPRTRSLECTATTNRGMVLELGRRARVKEPTRGAGIEPRWQPFQVGPVQRRGRMRKPR